MNSTWTQSRRLDSILLKADKQGRNRIRNCGNAQTVTAPACLATLPANAADYPARAIKMVVPIRAGGGTDVLGRIIGQRLSEQWASGGCGKSAGRLWRHRYARRRQGRPDGYTLLMASTRRSDGGFRLAVAGHDGVRQ